jgi:hypothetical protein
MRRHANKEHGLRWIANFKEIFEEVEIQTWFSNGRQRYWIVAAPKGSSPKQGGQRGKRRAESIEPDEGEAAVPVQGRRQKRRQVTVDKQARGGSVVGESGEQKEEVMANSAKRRVSVEAGKIEGGTQKRVRFAEHRFAEHYKDGPGGAMGVRGRPAVHGELAGGGDADWLAPGSDEGGG